jgi:hypothetical protein
MQAGNNETPTPSLLATVEEIPETPEMGAGGGRLLFMSIFSPNHEVNPMPVYGMIGQDLTLNDVRQYYKEMTGTPEALQILYGDNGRIEQGHVFSPSESGDNVVDVIDVHLMVGNFQVWGMDSLHPNGMCVETSGTFPAVALDIENDPNRVFRVFTVWTKEGCHGLEKFHELYDATLANPVDTINCANIAEVCAIQLFNRQGCLGCLVYTQIDTVDRAAFRVVPRQFPCMDCSMATAYETYLPYLTPRSHKEVIVHFDEERRQITILVDEDHTCPKKLLTIRNLPIGETRCFDGRMSVDVINSFDCTTPLAPSPIRDITPTNMDVIARLV